MRHWSALGLATLLALGGTRALAQDVGVSSLATAAPGTASTVTAPSGDDAPTAGGGLQPAAPADALPVAPPAAESTGAAPPPVRSLLTGAGSDLLRLKSADNALLVLVASATAAIVHPYDARLTTHFSTTRRLERFLASGEVIGGLGVQLGGSVATYALGRIVGHRRTTVVGADLVRAQILTQAFTQSLKLSLGRRRPDGDTWSLPSGHSSGTFSSATVLHRHFGWKVGVPAYAVATYVAASRLAERRHYASDVIVGAGLGIVSARAVTVGRGTTRFALAPLHVAGGAGVALTRVAN